MFSHNPVNMRIAATTDLSVLLIPVALPEKLQSQPLSYTLQLNDPGYFENPGLNIMVFNNRCNGLFNDCRLSAEPGPLFKSGNDTV